MARILAIDDERSVVDALWHALSRAGYEMVGITDLSEAVRMDFLGFDLVLCDVTLPGGDALDLVREIRRRADCQVLLLAPQGVEGAMVELGLGADDYVRKPFDLIDLRTKIASHLPRTCMWNAHSLTFGRVRLNPRSRRVAVNNDNVALTSTEYALCELLARNQGQILAPRQVREALPEKMAHLADEEISAQVSELREKLRRRGVDPISMVRCMGDRWRA